MNTVLRKFVPRAPRYVLRPKDEKFLRFAYQDDRSHSYSTQFINLSETGMAFSIDRETAPHIGDIIKVEFPIPGHSQVAWFARVIRIEEYSPDKDRNLYHQDSEDLVLVGIKFHDLPPGHRKAIREGLNKKFNDLLIDRYRNLLYQLTSALAAHFWKGLLYLSLLAGTAFLLYFFSLPDQNYDADRGAPWGQRYPSLNFFSPKKPEASP